MVMKRSRFLALARVALLAAFTAAVGSWHVPQTQGTGYGARRSSGVIFSITLPPP